MKGLIILLATIATCRAGYFDAPGGFQDPQIHSQPAPQRFAPPAPVGQDGNVIDTPEVAQAKAAHFAEFAKAAARAIEESKNRAPVENFNQQQPSYNFQSAQPSASPYQRQQAYQAPAAAYQPGPVHPVPSAPVYNRPSQSYQPQYDASANYVNQQNYGATMKPTTFVPAPLADDGTVIDTPEVAALKAARLAELADAEARVYKQPGPQEYSPSNHGQAYNAPPANSGHYNLGQFGAPGPVSRVHSPAGPTYSGPQAYSNPQGAFGKPYQAPYQPQNYQSQQLGRY